MYTYIRTHTQVLAPRHVQSIIESSEKCYLASSVFLPAVCQEMRSLVMDVSCISSVSSKIGQL